MQRVFQPTALKGKLIKSRLWISGLLLDHAFGPGTASQLPVHVYVRYEINGELIPDIYNGKV